MVDQPNMGAPIVTLPDGNMSLTFLRLLQQIANALNGSKDATSGRVTFALGGVLNVIVGSGPPEGVVSAEPSALYLNKSGGGELATLYVKESGTGNTGWIGK